MKRRTVIAACGAGLLAGCLGGDSSRDSTENRTGPATPRSTTTAGDGTASSDATGTPTDHAVDPSSFETVEENGQTVGLIPVVDAYQWHSEGAARFVDARGETAYEQSHIAGAVNSPATTDPEPGPTADWATDATVVTYCGCPHHLSVLRASQLKERGFETVYAIDEGFWAWHDRGYPVEGSNVTETPQSVEISGTLDASLAGEEVWAVHEPTAQREATEVASDGSYTMHLRFYGVDTDSRITLRTPDWTREVRLGELTAGG